MEAEEENTTKKGKARQATIKMLTTIADDCDNVLAFFQDITVKYPLFIADPLSLHADKRARVWFCC